MVHYNYFCINENYKINVGNINLIVLLCKINKLKYTQMPQSFINKFYFVLFVVALIFGVIIYDIIGFDFTDEICALFLIILFISYMFNTDNWRINKAFLIAIFIFIFYLCYSFHIKSNTTTGILTDFFIQIKPYLAFFCVYSMLPNFSINKKAILKSIVLIFWFLLLIIGIGDVFIHNFIAKVMGHWSYFAAAVTMTSLCYLYCSKFSTLDKITFLLMLSIGLLSGRSKFYGFFAFSTLILFFFNNVKDYKLSYRNVIVALFLLIAVVFVARDKMILYFYESATEDINNDMLARYVLYANCPEVLKDYFPFGSGLATYATHASGVHYSHIYVDYEIDNVWGMTKDNYSFISDTYYPSLAQFGVAGILLFILFWIYILRKAFLFSKVVNNTHSLTLIVLITGYLAIECTTDAMFTANRGFFLLMMLGMILGNIKEDYYKQIENPKAQ